MERSVSLFRNGRNRAVHIPREFELPGDTAVIRKEGDCLILQAAPKRSLVAALQGVRPLDPANGIDLINDLPLGEVDV